MIRPLGPGAYAVQCDICGAAGVGAESEPDARRVTALLGWRWGNGKDHCPKCTIVPRALFALGRLLQTKAVSERFAAEQLSELVRRHGRGDWGDVSNEDAQANALALHDEARIVSVYEIAEAGKAEPVKVWIITEADRATTTILFPEEY